MQDSRSRVATPKLCTFSPPLLALVATVLFTPSVLAETSLRLTPIVRAVRDASPAVVNIQGQKSVVETTEGARTPSAKQVNGMGTGVVVDPRGYILTNFHVVDGVRRINVTLSGGQAYVAQIVARDEKTDLAIIRIKTNSPLPVINVGTSQNLMPGETVIAVGNAYGYENTVTTGIISALHRNVQVNETQQYLDLIQTDASINPGNSGGPLLNIDGEMIGVNVAVRAGAQGIGFAIPIDNALEVATRLMSIQELENNWHGMAAMSLSHKGPVTVARVERQSPAEACGIERGDQVKRIGDVEIRRPIDIERALLGQRPGEKIPVLVNRNSEELEFSLSLASRGQASPQASHRPTPANGDSFDEATWQTLGLKLKEEPAHALRRLSLPYRGGMRVTAVKPNSSAHEQGVREGDILVRVHRWTTASEDDVRYLVNRADALAQSGPHEFYIVRGDKTYFGQLAVSRRATSTASR